MRVKFVSLLVVKYICKRYHYVKRSYITGELEGKVSIVTGWGSEVCESQFAIKPTV